VDSGLVYADVAANLGQFNFNPHPDRRRRSEYLIIALLWKWAPSAPLYSEPQIDLPLGPRA
jgi:hypothetical protein